MTSNFKQFILYLRETFRIYITLIYIFLFLIIKSLIKSLQLLARIHLKPSLTYKMQNQYFGNGLETFFLWDLLISFLFFFVEHERLNYLTTRLSHCRYLVFFSFYSKPSKGGGRWWWVESLIYSSRVCMAGV